MFGMLSGAWQYRFFIISSIKTELRLKFVRSRLGGLWMVLHPLSQVVLFAFVLSAALSTKLPGIDNRYSYAIYLMSGILGWSLFSEIVNRCLTMFIDNANLLKKLQFPRITLPLIATGSVLVNNILLLAAILLIFGALGHLPSAAIAWLPVLILINIALALGLGLVLGVLNVFVRDVGQVVPVVMQFLFWLTPIVYMADIIPVQFRVWLVLNPLIPIINGYHDILLYRQAPEWLALAAVAIMAAVMLAFALLLFRRANAEMVDQL